MKFINRMALLGLFALSAVPMVQAAEIQNLRVEPSDNYMNVFWDALPADELGGADGYALQFSDQQFDVKITKPANLFMSRGENSIALRRNSFKNDNYYFMRVYTYEPDENNIKLLGNGSDLLKFRVDYWDNVEKTSIAVNDPVVSSSNTGSDAIDKNSYFSFGELRMTEYDTFADLTWSKPVLMAKSDYDGFLVTLSTNSDLSDPILEETINQESYEARLKGLTPGTQYYIRASFYDRVGGENKAFGNDNIKSFKTLAAIPRDGSTRAARGIAKIERKVHGRSLNVGGSAAVTTTTTTTPVSTVSSSSSDSDIRARILALKSQITKLQTELNTLEKRIGVTPTTTTTTTTSTRRTTSSTSGSSRISKLKALLEARRNSR